MKELIKFMNEYEGEFLIHLTIEEGGEPYDENECCLSETC